MKSSKPYIVMTVVYNLLETYHKVSVNKENNDKKNEEWKQLLTEKDYPLYNLLREWRSKLAKKENKPAYIICHNKQLAEIANKRPSSLAGLAKIYIIHYSYFNSPFQGLNHGFIGSHAGAWEQDH